MGFLSKIGIKSFIIIVVDVNEYLFIFLQRQYVVNVLEILLVGSFIVNLVVEDKDFGINVKLIYKILFGNDNDWFEINLEIGLVILKK